MRGSSFWQDLRRHHVFRVAAAYAVAGWLVIQVVAVIFPLLEFPAWLARTIVVLVLAGFPVALVLAWAFDPPRGETPPAGARRRSLRIGLALGASGILVAIVGGAVWWYLGPIAHTGRGAGAGSARSAAEPVNPKSVAVLPLAVLGDEPDESYLGQGISEELLSALSRVPGLEVIGRASSFRFQASRLGTRAIGRELHVRNLLAGAVQRSGDELRVDVELDDAATGVTLWSAQYNEPMQNLFALEDEVSTAVAAALQVRLDGAGPGALVLHGTASARAHDLYLQGARLSWRTDAGSLDEALALFGQALAIDPDYAAAWAGTARAYANLADEYRAPLDVLPAMRGAADKAVALDPDSARGHLLLGVIAMSYDLDYPQARRQLELAVRLQPSLARGHALLGLYLARIGRNFGAARAQLQIAARLDPFNPWYPRWQAYVAIDQGDAAAALRLARRVDRIDPAFAYNGDTVAMVDGAFGRWQACVDRYTVQHAPASRLSPQLAVCEAHLGRTAEARAALARLEAEAGRGYVDRTYIAAILAALGDAQAAVAQLEEACRDRSSRVTSIWLNPWYRPLHGNPAFQALVARIAAGGHPGGPASAPAGASR